MTNPDRPFPRTAASRRSSRSMPGLLLVVGAALASLHSSCLITEKKAEEPGQRAISFAAINDSRTGRFSLPVWFGEHPSHDGRFIVAEQTGDVILLTPGPEGLEPSLFVHIPVAHLNYDGLLDIAFHPHFTENRKYYVASIPQRGVLVVEERLANAALLEDSGESRELLRVETTELAHNGGNLLFGPDGYLYIALGDGSTVTKFRTDSQDLRTFHGKLLRIDVDRVDVNRPYGIPSDNPFVDHEDSLVLPEIWAYGLRSPWRMSFSAEGRLFLVDVGHGVQDEVNEIFKGGNYGWRVREGKTCFNDRLPLSPLDSCETADLIDPVAVFEHELPFSVCLAGGEVFRGDPESRLYGAYVFGDHKQRRLYVLYESESGEWTTEELGQPPSSMSSITQDSRGNLYVIGYGAGDIHRIDHPDLMGRLTP